MGTLPLLLGLLLAAAEPVSTGPNAPGPGYRPSGSLAELHLVADLARLRDPGVVPVGFSSYDRTGGNNDGFKGTYSRLREEDGNSVLAELEGPGVLQRLWFTHSVDKEPGLLDRKGEHIRIYVDGRSEPALDVPIADLFAGRHPRFPRPLVSEGSGGFVSYVPIGFRNGCKVVVDGLGVRFYQIGAVKLPSAEGVISLADEPTAAEQQHRAAAVRLWSQPENLEALDIHQAMPVIYQVDAIERAALAFALPAGPRTLRSFEIIPAAGFEDAWRKARLRLVWDGDETAAPGVDLPLGYAFAQVEGGAPFRSLLAGQTEKAWYLRFPMPYRKQAVLRLDTEQPLRGSVRLLTVEGAEPDAGYFHAHYIEALPTVPKVDFPFLTDRGRGHYVGTFLATEGKARLPFWLEGDDRFTVDGRLAIHGTGSEDYFNCGWYALPGRLDRPAGYASHGFTVYGKSKNGELMRAAAYRWHLADPVPYVHSISAGIEHGEVNTFAADYRAAAFWYSDRPGLNPAGS